MFGEGRPAKVFGEGPSTMMFWWRQVGEAPHAEDLSKGDVGVDAEGVSEASCGEGVFVGCVGVDDEGVSEDPSSQSAEKSRENAIELIGCIFQGLS